MTAMHTANRIFIEAPLTKVYDLASRVEHWPNVLRHYRYVDVVDPAVAGDSRSRLVKMGATRSGIPVSWTSVQHLDRRKRYIRYRHVGGATLGMDVLWTLEPERMGVEVTIEHDLPSARWWLQPGPIAAFVGSFFVESIAGMTLAGIKRTAEAGR
ncbi:MAG TPA: SRPBCC family protein [Gemmatimonadaceae bacterium]